ncbi:MAG: PRC-barrel domain containing protein [Anaerolineae bacterium]|nr:PRC-barrel domain containing protein [Anaerolineae bacterium]
MQLLSSQSLLGTRVENSKGESLGTIKELMIDIKHGRIAYAVLDFGGFLGIGNKLFALPWGGFVLNTAREVIVLDIPRERLENAEGFDKDHWPTMDDPEFAARIYDYYGSARYWEAPTR